MSHLRQKIQELEQKNLMLHQKAVISFMNFKSQLAFFPHELFHLNGINMIHFIMTNCLLINHFTGQTINQ